MPTRLQACNTKLRAYNGTNIPQLSARDTTITWKDEEAKEVNTGQERLIQTRLIQSST